MLAEMLKNLRERKPVIHNITNYVTANDCANLLLACGASPVMADDVSEVEEITAGCDGLTLNLGTLHSHTIASMHLAGKRSNALQHPVVMDPVGVGASKFRAEAVQSLLEEIQFTVIRGNHSELRSMASGQEVMRGVDATREDAVCEGTLEKNVFFLRQFAKQMHTIAVMTGAIDIVSDGDRIYCIRNGHSMMETVTGAGCQLSSMITAFVSANPNHLLEAAVAAVCAMGLAGEIAQAALSRNEGNATYRTAIIDAIYRMTPELLEKGARYEVR